MIFVDWKIQCKKKKGKRFTSNFFVNRFSNLTRTPNPSLLFLQQHNSPPLRLSHNNPPPSRRLSCLSTPPKRRLINSKNPLTCLEISDCFDLSNVCICVRRRWSRFGSQWTRDCDDLWVVWVLICMFWLFLVLIEWVLL